MRHRTTTITTTRMSTTTIMAMRTATNITTITDKHDPEKWEPVFG